jgi:hypothetical protein
MIKSREIKAVKLYQNTIKFKNTNDCKRSTQQNQN